MSRVEKSVAFVVGTLVFVGLFIFIWSSLKTLPVAPPFNDDMFSDVEGGETFEFGNGADALEEPAPETAPTTSAKPPATQPTSRSKAGLKK